MNLKNNIHGVTIFRFNLYGWWTSLPNSNNFEMKISKRKYQNIAPSGFLYNLQLRVFLNNSIIYYFVI